jgi:multimeric flavodoxin WrbA
MKKVLVMDCSYRNGYTKAYADELIKRISSKYEVELINLKDKNISECRGCGMCLTIDKCPLKEEDDSLEILDKMMSSDGIIYITPNYSLQVPGKLKMLLDRLAFVFHRPRLFNRVFMPIVVQGIFGGDKICSYMNEVFSYWGTITVKGTVLQGGVYTKEIDMDIHNEKNFIKFEKAIKIFNNEMDKENPKRASIFQTMLFYLRRSAMNKAADIFTADRQYFIDNGWDKSTYYYPVKLGLIRNIIRIIFDSHTKNS